MLEVNKYIPQIDPEYIKGELFDEVSDILDTSIFFPVYIKGESGVGKSLTVEQVCAEKKREFLRVPITIESDEDALMGGFRLVEENGASVTKFIKGPVIEAMERGAVLLLDEYDLGSPTRMMCLQAPLEGKGYLIKKTGEYVSPKKGFMIIATGNTKGAGDDTGMYIGTQMLNDAALDRFSVCIDVPFPEKEFELRILNRRCQTLGIDHSESGKGKDIELLVNFANKIRETVAESQSISYNISTRRLVKILEAYVIYKDWRKAIEKALSRFDSHHQESYLSMLDAMSNPVEDTEDDGLAVEDAKLLEEMRKLEAF